MPKTRLELSPANGKSATNTFRRRRTPKDKTPPVMIVVCDNTDIAEMFFRKISGEEEVEVITEDGGKTKTKKRTKTAYSQGSVFPELLSNEERRFYERSELTVKKLKKAERADSDEERVGGGGRITPDCGDHRQARETGRTGAVRRLRG